MPASSPQRLVSWPAWRTRTALWPFVYNASKANERAILELEAATLFTSGQMSTHSLCAIVPRLPCIV